MIKIRNKAEKRNIVSAIRKCEKLRILFILSTNELKLVQMMNFPPKKRIENLIHDTCVSYRKL